MADQNNITPRAAAASSSSNVKYKGVRLRKWGKYVSEIRLPNSRERIWLGSYDTAEKAARAFDAALYCLRGLNAKFNFPEDPPNIAGGRALNPAEIQTVAQHYGNSFSGGSSSNQAPAAEPSRAMELDEYTSPSSNSEGTAGPMDSIDWSFLDTLGSDNIGANSGHVSDFGLFHDPGDHMYLPMSMPSHFEDHKAHDNDDGDDDDHGNADNAPFLWSF